MRLRIFSILPCLKMPTAAQVQVDFAHGVVPILRKDCVECHGGDESKGGLSINTRALMMDRKLIKPVSPEDSLLIEVLTEENPD